MKKKNKIVHHLFCFSKKYKIEQTFFTKMLLQITQKKNKSNMNITSYLRHQSHFFTAIIS